MARHLMTKQKQLLDKHRWCKKWQDLPDEVYFSLEQLNDFETIQHHIDDHLQRNFDADAVKPEEAKHISHWLQLGEKDDQFLIKDIATHGCAGGVPGLVYYRETGSFYNDFHLEIWLMIGDYAADAGQKTGHFLGAIVKDASSRAQFKNALVWWAVEVRAQELLEKRNAA